MSRYVRALQAGDVDAAMRERCAAARIEPTRKKLFADQTRELLAATGPLTVEVSVPGRVKVAPFGHNDKAIDFDYRVTADGHSTTLHGAALEQDGAMRLCGYAQQDVDRFTAEFTNVGSSGTSPHHAMVDLLPTEVPDSYGPSADEDVPLKPDSPPGRVESASRVWHRGSYGGARVSAFRYETPDLAARAFHTFMSRVVADTTATFTLPGRPGVVGVRYAGVAWTWIQPPDVGSQIDATYALMGDTVLTAVVSALEPGDDHHDVIAFTEAALALVG
jgi:hypothetical protein